MRDLTQILFILGMTLFVIACNSDNTTKEKFTKVHSFSNYGLSIDIKGPDDLKIEKKETSLPYEFGLEGTDFKVFLTGEAAENTDVKVIKDNLKKEIEALTEGFEIVLDEEQGFIFSRNSGRTDPEDTSKYYNFYYVHLLEDTLFKFTSTTVDSFTKEQILDMYKSIKQ